MLRREPEGPPAPPVELVDYRAWAAGRGLPAYGDPDDPESLRAAVVRWKIWRDERAAWCAQRGVDEWDVLGPRGAAPVDWGKSHPGLWVRPKGEDEPRCAEHGLREDEH
jgi:hypothetical protein